MSYGADWSRSFLGGWSQSRLEQIFMGAAWCQSRLEPFFNSGAKTELLTQLRCFAFHFTVEEQLLLIPFFTKNSWQFH